MFLICKLAGDHESSVEAETDSVKKIEKSSKTDHDEGNSADRELLPQLGETRSSSTPSELTKADPDKRKKRPRRGRVGQKVVCVSEVNK